MVGVALDIQISRLAVQLAEDDLRQITALFASARAAPPQVIWNPQPHQLPSPVMRILLTAWEEAGGRRRKASGPPTPTGSLAAIRDDIVCLAADPSEGLVYTHVGDRAESIFGDRILGRSVSAVLAELDTVDFILYAAGYLASRIREAPLLTFNESRRGPLRAITRLVVPYWGKDGGVSGFVTAITAFDRGPRD